MSASRDTRRRLEQWLANPACEANAVSAVAGVSMADVARAEGLEPTMGQSPFAIARSVTFEAALFRDDAKALREELARVGVPGGEVPGLLDLRLRMNGGSIADQETASVKTREWLHAAASNPQSVAPLVASATLKVPGQPIMLPDGVLAIDALLLHAPAAMTRSTTSRSRTPGGSCASVRSRATPTAAATRIGDRTEAETALREAVRLERDGSQRTRSSARYVA